MFCFALLFVPGVFLTYRINLFYEDSYCLSLECLESEDDMREMVTRMQTVAPKLTASHEVREGGREKGSE